LQNGIQKATSDSIEVQGEAAVSSYSNREVCKMREVPEHICAAAVEQWGAVAQVDMVIEEMSELIKALQKYKRSHSKFEKAERLKQVAEEHADVQIMLSQLQFIMRAENEDYIDFKMHYWNQKVLRVAVKLNVPFR
jgi:NTP pyrophosphatase (non-canonical NTP hydrolase)